MMSCLFVGKYIIVNYPFRLEDQLLSARIAEVESQAELKDQRLKVMDLETNVSNFLKFVTFWH